MMAAIAVYRAQFRPSQQLDRPYVMLGFNVFAADTLEEARFRATSMQQAFVNLRSGAPTQLPPPVEGYLERIGPHERGILEQVLACASIGTPEIVGSELRDFVERTGADELMITSQIFDHAARLRSYEIAARVLADVPLERQGVRRASTPGGPFQPPRYIELCQRRQVLQRLDVP